MATLYASFVSLGDAERAAGALLDQGAVSEDLAMLASEAHSSSFAPHVEHDVAAESAAKTGISTTTAGDAAYGAVKGSVIGLGVGALAALGALLIPGIGIVIGGGALATALAGTLGSAAAGAAAGGVAGFLKDQGVGETYVSHYSDALHSGGSVLSINIPTGRLSAVEVEQILAKYGAGNIHMVGGDESLMGHEDRISTDPLDAPEMRTQVVAAPASPTTLGTAPSVPGVMTAPVNAVDIEPTVVDPITGEMRQGVATDPVTGFERPVSTVSGAVFYADQAQVVEPISPSGFTLADVVATSTDPVSGMVTEGFVTEPGGSRRMVRIVNGSLIYADAPGRTLVEETAVVEKPPVVDIRHEV
ncbi:MAG: hypothetical protein ACAH95_14185 [Fimbriimonas sp.]